VRACIHVHACNKTERLGGIFTDSFALILSDDDAVTRHMSVYVGPISVSGKLINIDSQLLQQPSQRCTAAAAAAACTTVALALSPAAIDRYDSIYTGERLAVFLHNSQVRQTCEITTCEF